MMMMNPTAADLELMKRLDPGRFARSMIAGGLQAVAKNDVALELFVSFLADGHPDVAKEALRLGKEVVSGQQNPTEENDSGL